MANLLFRSPGIWNWRVFWHLGNNSNASNSIWYIRQIIDIGQSFILKKKHNQNLSLHTHNFYWVEFKTEMLKSIIKFRINRIYLLDAFQVSKFIYRQWLIYALKNMVIHSLKTPIYAHLFSSLVLNHLSNIHTVFILCYACMLRCFISSLWSSSIWCHNLRFICTFQC